MIITVEKMISCSLSVKFALVQVFNIVFIVFYLSSVLVLLIIICAFIYILSIIVRICTVKTWGKGKNFWGNPENAGGPG